MPDLNNINFICFCILSLICTALIAQYIWARKSTGLKRSISRLLGIVGLTIIPLSYAFWLDCYPHLPGGMNMGLALPVLYFTIIFVLAELILFTICFAYGKILSSPRLAPNKSLIESISKQGTNKVNKKTRLASEIKQ